MRARAIETTMLQDAADLDEAQGLSQERRRVSETDLAAIGIDLERDFPGQSIKDLREYPVLSEGGWFIVIRNQHTLQEIARQSWRLLGPVELLSHSLVLD